MRGVGIDPTRQPFLDVVVTQLFAPSSVQKRPWDAIFRGSRFRRRSILRRVLEAARRPQTGPATVYHSLCHRVSQYVPPCIFGYATLLSSYIKFSPFPIYWIVYCHLSRKSSVSCVQYFLFSGLSIVTCPGRAVCPVYNISATSSSSSWRTSKHNQTLGFRKLLLCLNYEMILGRLWTFSPKKTIGLPF